MTFSKKSKNNSPSKPFGSDRQATETLKLLQRVTAETRQMKRQRAILPKLLPAKVKESFEFISNETRRVASLEMTLVESLVSVFKKKSLKPSEWAMVRKIIVRLVKNVAERCPDLVTPVARKTAEAYLGETLEESLQKELREYLGRLENAHIMEVARQGNFSGEVMKARSISDVERIGSIMRRKMYPACVGDLEYFFKVYAPDPEDLQDVRQAVDLIEMRLGQETKEVASGSNVISINGAAGGVLSLGAMAAAGDVIGCLEVLISHPAIKTLDRLIEGLSESEQGCLLAGLISQQKIIELETELIISHPDFEQIAGLIGGFSELMTFNPEIMMKDLTKREVFVTTITTEILRGKSVRAVRALINDYVRTAMDVSMFGDDDDIMD